jgi:hypothetical protein
MVKVVATASGSLLTLPLVGSAPLHPPDAEQAVAPVLDHESVVRAPDATVVGEAANVTTGGGEAVTSMVADLDT